MSAIQTPAHSARRKRISTTLIKGLDVLTLLSATSQGLALSEILEAIHEPRSNVLRSLESLALYGLVEHSGRRWRVTGAFSTWAVRDRHHQMRERYRPILEEIARSTGELVLLGLHEGNGIIHLDYIESDHTIRVAPAPDTRHNLRVNALGKLALSRRPDLCEDLNEPALLRELDEIRRTGIAWNREESVKGMIALACPGFTNQPTEAMLAIAWPVFRFTESKAEAAIAAIRDTLNRHQ